MLTTLKKIWNDEGGFVNSMELILVATLAVLGLIVGLVALRDSVTQELGDTGAAVGQLNQSYGVYVGDSDNTITTDGPVITSAGANGFVTVERDFSQPNESTNVVVSVTSRFRNFQYDDRTDVGDGQDSNNSVPPTIVSISDVHDEGDVLTVP